MRRAAASTATGPADCALGSSETLFSGDQLEIFQSLLRLRPIRDEKVDMQAEAAQAAQADEMSLQHARAFVRPAKRTH